MEENLPFKIPTFDNVELDENCGEDIGSFKSVKDLKNAYDSLRSCFTKNAMELAKIKKGEKEIIEESDKVNAPDEQVEKADAPTTKTYIWDKADWTDDIENFFIQNPEAKEYSKELASRLVEDKTLSEQKDPLLQAWVRVLKENNKPHDEEFWENKFYQNQDFKDKIIKEYLSNVKSAKSAPPVISTREGVTNITSPKPKVSSLDDAKLLAKKLFE
ncbi:MAG: hypothetical protein IKQ31_02860 [Clostridia bacterium]|nr:hypothetical protein [Clostridia bacterium]